MTLVTSPNFASIAATGADWRTVARQLLAALEPLRARAEPFNLGFLYVSDHLAAETENILAVMRAVSGIECWVGAVGLGVCTSGTAYVDKPAASLLVGRLAPGSFQIFPVTDLTLAGARDALEPWLDHHEALLLLAHGDPLAETDPALVLAELERLTGGFIVGGMSSSRRDHVVIADQGGAGGVGIGGIGGAAFSSDVAAVTALTQGCVPFGPVHVVTAAEDNILMELDGRPAFDVFAQDLKDMALARAGEDMQGADIREILTRDGADALPEDPDRIFKGEVHMAIPVAGSDMQDYMVRNISGVDPESGCMALPQALHPGDHVMFVHRDDETVRTDLTRMLMDVRERVLRDHGRFAPQAAIYISCVARAMTGMSAENQDSGGEMAIVRGFLGDIPLAGFYANGEISNQRLYGHTGVLILFL
ncbi:MAG: FIST C-terminal domain-containing protein [Micavibrio aeruginosavorus]|nr:FIST C-terminal domain-containing protein [Micavibrio aeruginosavorus]